MPNNYQVLIAVSTGKVLKLLIIAISLRWEHSLASFLFILATDRFNDPNSPHNLISFSKATGVCLGVPTAEEVLAILGMFCPCLG